VCEFGMSATMGPVRYVAGPSAGQSGAGDEGPGPSASTAADIDREVRVLLQEQAKAARAAVEADRSALDAISETLLHREDLDREEFLDLLHRHGDCSTLPM
jgi:cell division protease FtsH